MGIQGYSMEELVPIVAKLAEGYTGHESTSVTYETAQQLMGAVLYCIHEYESYGKNQLSLQGTTAGEAYQLGRQLVLEKAGKARKRYHTLEAMFCPYHNRCLQDTIKAIPEFFQWYDAVYAPQDTILTLDYPVLADLSRYTGVDALYEYLGCLCQEQKFLGKLEEAYIRDVLEGYSPEYEEMVENLCWIVLDDLAGHFLLKKPMDGKRLSLEDRDRLPAVLEGLSVTELEVQVGAITQKIVEAYYQGDTGLLAYLQKCVQNLSQRMHFFAKSVLE